MKIRNLDRSSKRVPVIIYDDPDYPIKASIIERTDPTKATGVDYFNTSGQSAAGSAANCTGGATKNHSYRLCYLRKWLKKSGIKYYYYTGHKYTAKQVISKKKGNCCDLTRMCASILKSSSLPVKTAGYPMSSIRYCVGSRTYNGKTFRHAWLEVLTSTTATGSKTITCTGKDSCGKSAYNPAVTKTYLNYCTECGRTGHLICSSAVPEKELHCATSTGGCGADFCVKDGWEKSGHYRSKLKSATQQIETWKAFDPTSYVTSTSEKVIGTSAGTVTHKSTSSNPC